MSATTVSVHIASRSRKTKPVEPATTATTSLDFKSSATSCACWCSMQSSGAKSGPRKYSFQKKIAPAFLNLVYLGHERVTFGTSRARHRSGRCCREVTKPRVLVSRRCHRAKCLGARRRSGRRSRWRETLGMGNRASRAAITSKLDRYAGISLVLVLGDVVFRSHRFGLDILQLGSAPCGRGRSSLFLCAGAAA